MSLQTFTTEQLNEINQGKLQQTILKNLIDEALNHNTFNENYIISSLPGLGKSYETQQALDKMPNRPLMFQGSSSMPAFSIEIATAVYLSKGQRLVVVLDDCDSLFESKNINIAKKMFDDARVLKYGKNYRGLEHLTTPLQFEAISSFSSEESSGFAVPLDNVTFIILTNKHFSTVNEAELGKEYDKDTYAIRRRTAYKSIEMNNRYLWGYVANVVLNEHICEKFNPTITLDAKHQILTWCSERWDRVTERNLSLVEKMTKDMVRYPQNYLDIWAASYVK